VKGVEGGTHWDFLGKKGRCPVPSEWVGGRDEGQHLRIIMMPAWIRLLARL